MTVVLGAGLGICMSGLDLRVCVSAVVSARRRAIDPEKIKLVYLKCCDDLMRIFNVRWSLASVGTLGQALDTGHTRGPSSVQHLKKRKPWIYADQFMNVIRRWIIDRSLVSRNRNQNAISAMLWARAESSCSSWGMASSANNITRRPGERVKDLVIKSIAFV